MKGSTAAASPEDNLPAVGLLFFTVKCGYNPGKSTQSAQPTWPLSQTRRQTSSPKSKPRSSCRSPDWQTELVKS
jgi:hypothetical protein